MTTAVPTIMQVTWCPAPDNGLTLSTIIAGYTDDPDTYAGEWAASENVTLNAVTVLATLDDPTAPATKIDY